MDPQPVLRPVVSEDQEFLFRLYAATRAGEFSALGWSQAQLEPLLRMQYGAQRTWYETAYPQSQYDIVMLDGAPVGRMIVQHLTDAVVLVDIALLPEHRGRGIGDFLLRNLLEQSSQQRLTVRLQVLKTNPAARLYDRLGFVKTGEDQMYWHMEKSPERAR